MIGGKGYATCRATTTIASVITPFLVFLFLFLRFVTNDVVYAFSCYVL
jgi:hypothetical protein